MPNKKPKAEVTRSSIEETIANKVGIGMDWEWVEQAKEALEHIQTLSASILSLAKQLQPLSSGKKEINKDSSALEAEIAQLVMKRGEKIRELTTLMDKEQVVSLPSEIKQDLLNQLSSINDMDLSSGQQFGKSLEALHKQLIGLKDGKRTLAGYHLPTGNTETFTRSNHV